MKLVSFVNQRNEERLGVLLFDENSLVDLLELSRNREPTESVIFGNMTEFLASGDKGFTIAKSLISNVDARDSQDADEKSWMVKRESCKILAPVPRPGKIIHTTGNFVEHQKEISSVGYSGDLVHPWVSFLKRHDAVIGTDEGVMYPKITHQLDYEIEVATIIGRRCKYVSKQEALNYVAGYTIFNDISARDIQMEEHKHGAVNMGKNLDTFAPMGPCMVTTDDISDPQDLDMELRVNNTVRQKGSTKSMRITIAELVAHYSSFTLNPGDIITTGTISGSGYFRKDNEKYLLQIGDKIEAEVSKVGILRNQIVADSGKPYP